MPGKRFSVERIINHPREAGVLLARGQTVGEVCRHIGVSEQSYYRWHREYGGRRAMVPALDERRQGPIDAGTASAPRAYSGAGATGDHGWAGAGGRDPDSRFRRRYATAIIPARLPGDPASLG